MNRVILESPYNAPTELGIQENVAYARRCVRDCLKRNESPLASHLLFTQPNILRDNIPEERELGIRAGLVWLPVADYSVFYTDRGWSSGMLGALHDHALKLGRDFRIRALDGAPKLPTSLLEEVEELLKSKVESNDKT